MITHVLKEKDSRVLAWSIDTQDGDLNLHVDAGNGKIMVAYIDRWGALHLQPITNEETGLDVDDEFRIKVIR